MKYKKHVIVRIGVSLIQVARYWMQVTGYLGAGRFLTDRNISSFHNRRNRVICNDFAEGKASHRDRLCL